MISDDPQEIPEAPEVTGADAPAAPAILDEPSGTPPPRLGIIHLLAWLTVSAVFLGTERSVQILEKAASHPDTIAAHYLVLESIRAVALASGVVGLAALIHWRVGVQPRPLAPGHWILYIEIIALLLVFGVETARRIIVAVWDVSNVRASYTPALAIYAPIAAAQMIAFAAAALRCVEKGGWQWIFGMLAVASAAQMTLDVVLILIVSESFRPSFPLFDFFYPAPAIVAAVVSGITINFAAYDAFRFRRDWLHGLGVALVFVNGLMWVGYLAASRYVR
jgi:hypothetical protein